MNTPGKDSAGDRGMPPVGTEVRDARQRAGLSAAQIGERTNFPLYNIEALENGDFDTLPEDIYLDEIVLAYAREVGLDPEPLIARVR
jgi:cytoskeletal protein RodZ